ncbi:MAG: Ku protein, partial [Betaproteobacteria bacterium]
AGQSICIMGFVDGDVIPPSCYDEPYCLQPNKNDSKAYDVLREVMHRTHKVGLAAVVIERKQTLAAVIPIGRTLVLNVLRLASGLIPGTKRGANRQPPVAVLPPPRRASSPSTVAKRNARPAAVDADGEVIDLAVRRSNKRATQATAKGARTRTTTVATLHELRRKPALKTSPAQRQLA